MDKPISDDLVKRLISLSLKSRVVINLVRAIPKGDNQYTDKLYHYGFGALPGSVIQAIYPVIHKNPIMSDDELLEYIRSDETLINQLEANLKWEYSNPEFAQKLRIFEKTVGLDVFNNSLHSEKEPISKTQIMPDKACRHPYDRQKFSLCPYCNPPTYEEICQSRIFRLYFSARSVAGDYKYVKYYKNNLKYAQGTRVLKPFEKEVNFSGASLEELNKAVLLCHIEKWQSYDSTKPIRLGVNQPYIEIEFENAKQLFWQNSTPQETLLFANVEKIISDALGIEFHLIG